MSVEINIPADQWNKMKGKIFKYLNKHPYADIPHWDDEKKCIRCYITAQPIYVKTKRITPELLTERIMKEEEYQGGLFHKEMSEWFKKEGIPFKEVE
jgi:hypothetical protein